MLGVRDVGVMYCVINWNQHPVFFRFDFYSSCLRAADGLAVSVRSVTERLLVQSPEPTSWKMCLCPWARNLALIAPWSPLIMADPDRDSTLQGCLRGSWEMKKTITNAYEYKLVHVWNRTIISIQLLFQQSCFNQPSFQLFQLYHDDVSLPWWCTTFFPQRILCGFLSF